MHEAGGEGHHGGGGGGGVAVDNARRGGASPYSPFRGARACYGDDSHALPVEDSQCLEGFFSQGDIGMASQLSEPQEQAVPFAY